MTRDEIKRWWFDLFGVKFKNSATYRAVEEKLDQICDAHEAELTKACEILDGANLVEIERHFAECKAKDERIAELEAKLKNMCAECECAKFADNAIKPSEMWKLHLALKDNE